MIRSGTVAILSAFLLGAACLLAPHVSRAQDGEPVLLVVPLISPPEAQDWIGPSLDRALAERLRVLEGLSFVTGEKKQEALQRIASEPQIGPEQLGAATELAGAHFAVVGQFGLGEGGIGLDIRIFSTAEMGQIASVNRQGPVEDVFLLLSEVTAAVAEAIGVAVSQEESDALAREPTRSLEAYHLFHQAQGEKDQAKRFSLLQRAVELDPEYLDANLKLGLDYYQSGKVMESLPFMEKAAQLGSDLPEVHNNLAVIYAQLGRKKDALAEFEKALDLKSDYPEARLNYGRLLEENGRFDQAEGVYTDLLDEDPDNVKARSSLALLYERTGRTELAIQEFRVLSRRSPELAEEYFLQGGRDARKAKEFQKAELFFQRVVDINPQFSQGYAELGTNSYLAEEYEKSMEYFRQALALEPQRGEYHYYLGLAQDRSGREGEARQSFVRAVDLGGPPGARVSLARIYLAEGKVTQAVEELDVVLQEDPGNADAKELLSRAMSRAETEQKREQQRAELATHRLERLESIVEDLTVTNRDLEQRLLAVQNERTALSRELEQLREERDRRESEYGRRMESAIRSIEDLSGSSDFEVLRREYEAQVRTLEEQLAAAKESLEEARLGGMSGGEKIGQILARERLRASSLDEEAEKLRGRLEEATSEIGLLSAEVEKLRKKESERLEEMAALQRRIGELQTARTDEDRELSKLRERSRGLQERADGLEKDLARARKDLEGARQEADRLQRSSSETVRETADLREEAGALKAERESLSKELDEVRSGYEELVVRAAGLERQLQEAGALKAERESLSKELDEVRSGHEGLVARAAGLERQLQEATQAAEAERSRTAELQERLLTSVTSREGEIAALRESEGKATLENERLQKKVAGLEMELENVEGQISRLFQSEGELRESLEAARRELSLQALELGKLHMANRSWEKASLYFQKVLEAEPLNAEAYYSLGEIYFQLGRYDLSKEMYDKAKDIY